jgi:hypothetical protein
VTFGAADTLKVVLTAKENGKAKRPHQAFLVLQETETGLEAPFPLTTKENGKAIVDIVRLSPCPYNPSILSWLTFRFTETYRYPRPTPVLVQAPQGVPDPCLLWFVRGLRRARLRCRDQVGSQRSTADLREAPTVRQA